ARASGLSVERLAPAYIHANQDGTIRLDPIGVFTPDLDHDPPPGPAVQIVDLLDWLLGDEDGTRAFPGAGRVLDLVERWLSDRDPAPNALPALVADLRAATGQVAPTSAIPGAGPAANGSRRAYPDIDDTLDLDQWP